MTTHSLLTHTLACQWIGVYITSIIQCCPVHLLHSECNRSVHSAILLFGSTQDFSWAPTHKNLAGWSVEITVGQCCGHSRYPSHRPQKSKVKTQMCQTVYCMLRIMGGYFEHLVYVRFLCNGYRVFPGDKEWPERDADPSPPSSAIGHERVQVYLYSPYGPYSLYRASVPVQGCTLPSLCSVLLLIKDLGWRSGQGTALLVRGSRDRSPVTGDFFQGIRQFHVPWGRLSL